jgi:hypothetical protein
VSQLLPDPSWLITGAVQPNGQVLVMATPDLARWRLEAVYLDAAGGIVVPDGHVIDSSESWLEIELSTHIRGRVAFAAGATWAEAMADIADIMARWDAEAAAGRPPRLHGDNRPAPPLTRPRRALGR